MARTKGMGYTPDTFDQQFIKVLVDLQTRNIELAKNEQQLEGMLGLARGVIWKVKKNVAGISKVRRDKVVTELQLLFDVNPLFFAKPKEQMYNNGTGPVVAEVSPEEYGNSAKSKSIMTAGDHIELLQLRVQVNSLIEQNKALQEQNSALKKLVALYEKTGNFSAKES